MSAMVTAEASHSFAALGAGTVYDAWTDPVVARRWMTFHLKKTEPSEEITKVEIDPKVGGRFSFADTRDGSEVWGNFRELDKPRRVVFTWFVTPEEEEEDRSVVSIDIVPEGGSCFVTIRHEMGAEWADYVERTAKAWKSMLVAIEESLT